MELIPVYWYVSIAFLLGAALGSFANVVIDRMHTGKSLNDRSRCFSCGKTLVWYELVPLLSYTVLAGRCYACRARIPSRFFVVELLMGVLFVAVLTIFGVTLGTLLAWVLCVLLLIILVYDIRHLIIPNELSLAVAGFGVVWVLYILWPNVLTVAALEYLLSGVGAAGVYYLLWKVSKGRWIGLGDAKLAFGLGMMVGLTHLFSFVVLSFWVGAFISIGLLLLQKGKTNLHLFPQHITMKSEVPFAPFLITAFLLVYLFGVDVLSITNHVFSLIFNTF